MGSLQLRWSLFSFYSFKRNLKNPHPQQFWKCSLHPQIQQYVQIVYPWPWPFKVVYKGAWEVSKSSLQITHFLFSYTKQGPNDRGIRLADITMWSHQFIISISFIHILNTPDLQIIWGWWLKSGLVIWGFDLIFQYFTAFFSLRTSYGCT